MKLSDIEKLNAAVRARRPMALVTWPSAGRQELLPHPDQPGGESIPAGLADVLRERFPPSR